MSGPVTSANGLDRILLSQQRQNEASQAALCAMHRESMRAMAAAMREMRMSQQSMAMSSINSLNTALKDVMNMMGPPMMSGVVNGLKNSVLISCSPFKVLR